MFTSTASIEDEEMKEGDTFVRRATEIESNTLTPLAIVHETEWCEDEEAIKLPIGG